MGVGEFRSATKDGYGPVWRAHRAHLVRFWQSAGATFALIGVFELMHLPPQIPLLAGSVLVLFYQGRYRDFRCPRCDHRFYSNRWGAVWHASACRNCGLPLEAPLIQTIRRLMRPGDCRASRRSEPEPELELRRVEDGDARGGRAALRQGAVTPNRLLGSTPA